MAEGKSILFVIGSFHVGGAETQLSVLAKELVKRGWKVHLFSLESEGPLRKSLDESGVHTYGGGYAPRVSRITKVALLLGAQLQLFALAIKLRPQVLHALLPLTNFMGALAGCLARIETIVTSRRALGTHQERHCWWPWLDRVANALSNVITANSQAVIDDTIRRDRADPSRMHLIYNGIDLKGGFSTSAGRKACRSDLGLADENTAIVFVANLIPYKGHRELIQAFAKVNERYPSIRLFLIGEDRGIGQSLKEFAASLGVERSTTFLGRRTDVPKLLDAMDVGVMASHEEGFSNALLEKLAAGLPVVATNVGGNPEALAGMPDCILVNPKDSDDLARGLATMLSTLSEARQHGEKRRGMVIERYSVQRMVDQHEMIYHGQSKGDQCGFER